MRGEGKRGRERVRGEGRGEKGGGDTVQKFNILNCILYNIITVHSCG